MKPTYILAVLLPLASQLASASPVAEAGDHQDDLDKNKGHDNGNDHQHNPCEVKVSYPYYVFPCKSAPSKGTSQLGATFTSSCKYQDENDKHASVWLSTPRGWVKDEDKPRHCQGAEKECTF